MRSIDTATRRAVRILNGSRKRPILLDMKTERYLPPTGRQLRKLEALVAERGLPLAIVEQPKTQADATRILNRLLQGDLSTRR